MSLRQGVPRMLACKLVRGKVVCREERLPAGKKVCVMGTGLISVSPIT